ncbi:MAG: MAPEG family protein [Bauldia litoralis]
MSLLTMENPVFVTYVIAASIMILKLMGQGWVTVVRMMGSEAGLLNPEDLKPGPANRNPRPEQLAPNDYVERSRRIQRNDLENIPGFLAAGLLFVAVGPSLILANILMYAFVITRLAHTVAYTSGQRHEVRATFYTVGSVIVIVMAVYALVAALF